MHKLDETLRTYRDSTLPEVGTRSGFQGGLVLTDRGDGRTIAISLWDTESAMTKSPPPDHVDAVSGGPPVLEVYDVSVYDRLEAETSNATHARVTTRQLESGKMDEAIHTYLNSAVPLRRHQGSIGAILLTDRSTGKVLNITLWKSESKMDAAFPSGDVDTISVGQHTRDTYEVSADI